jgi:hydroxymethylglutaryl-CoA lyase
MSINTLEKRFPKRVSLNEVGPRDGFQHETQLIPMPLKVEIIHTLIDAGLQEIQVGAFVNPKRVPQMANIEDLVKHLPLQGQTRLTGLVLNVRGLERARECGMKWVEISVSASDAHSRNNTGMSLSQAMEQAREMLDLANQYGMGVIGSIQCAFGCLTLGEISPDAVRRIAQAFLAHDIFRLSAADTTGMANPLSVNRLLNVLIPEAGPVPLGLHLHDTRGLGLVNLMAGMECGLSSFDTSFGGMGGCPFVKGAAGNIATEDTLYLMESLGIETGVDRLKVGECSKKIADISDKPLAGKLYRLEVSCQGNK